MGWVWDDGGGADADADADADDDDGGGDDDDNYERQSGRLTRCFVRPKGE